MGLTLGLVCVDGVVLAADSAVTLQRGIPVKRSDVQRIFKVGDFFAISGAGSLPFVQECRDSIIAEYERLTKEGEGDLSFSSFKDVAGAVVAGIYGSYSQRMRATGIAGSVNVTMILAGVEKTSNGLRKHLYVVYNTGLLEQEEKYTTLGSGSAYAELLLGGSRGYYRENLTLREGMILAYFMMKEIGEVDYSIGGPVRMVTLSESGYRSFSEHELSIQIDPGYERKRRELITQLDLESMLGRIEVEDLKKALNGVHKLRKSRTQHSGDDLDV